MIPKMDKIDGERVYWCGICLEIHDEYKDAGRCCEDEVAKPVSMEGCYQPMRKKSKQWEETMSQPAQDSFPKRS